MRPHSMVPVAALLAGLALRAVDALAEGERCAARAARDDARRHTSGSPSDLGNESVAIDRKSSCSDGFPRL